MAVDQSNTVSKQCKLSPALEKCSLMNTAHLKYSYRVNTLENMLQIFFEKYTMSAVPRKRTVHR